MGRLGVDLSSAILDILSAEHSGRANAIKREHLRNKLASRYGIDISDRELRETVTDMVSDEDEPQPICTVSNASGGYYIGRDRADFEIPLREIDSRVAHLEARGRGLRRCRRRLAAEAIQMSLEEIG